MKEIKDVIDWGQGYDDTIIELLKAFKKFRDGYYELINYGDDWWKAFNQGVDFDEIMKEQWQKIDANDFMNSIEKMTVAIIGTYIKFDEFVDGVVEAYDSRKRILDQAIDGEGKDGNVKEGETE